MAMEVDGERSFKTLGLSDRACIAMEQIGGGRPPDGFLSSSLTHLISGGDFNCSISERLRSLKIATYMVTMIEKFNKPHLNGGGVRALILTATRDMASHTFKRANEFFSSPDIVVVLLDGEESDLERLGGKKPVAVIVTPDTLMRYLSAADGIMSLHSVELLVIDGAYEMLRLGVADHLNQILALGQLGEDRQTLLFTTETNAEVCGLANKFLRPQHKVVMAKKRHKFVMAKKRHKVVMAKKQHKVVTPSPYVMMLEKISSLTLGQEQPCVGVGQPNYLQKRERMSIDDDNGEPKKKVRLEMPVSQWISVYNARPFMKQRYHYNVADLRLNQHIKKGNEDGLYISSVASCKNLWALVMDSGTGFTSQVYKLSPVFLCKKWIMEQWEKNYLISSVAGAANGSSLVVMSKGSNYVQQSYKVAETFPLKWINKKRNEGFFVTAMATAGSKWAIVVSRGAGFVDQVVELDFLYPSEGVHRRWENGFRITATAATPDQAALVLSVPGSEPYAQDSLRTSTFPSLHVKAKWGKNLYIAAMCYGRTLSGAIPGCLEAK